MIAIGLFCLRYLLGNYAAWVNAKDVDLQDDVRGGVKMLKGTENYPRMILEICQFRARYNPFSKHRVVANRVRKFL